MFSNPKILNYLSLGLLGTLVLLCGMKKLRSDRVLTVLMVVTFLVTIFGVIIRNPGLDMKGENAADGLWSPFLYVALYYFLRKLYIRKYGCEPTYYRMSWYDPEEKRKQNWLDVFTFLFPLFFAVFVPLVFHLIFKTG